MSYASLGALCPPCTIELGGGCEPCPDASLPECRGCSTASPAQSRVGLWLLGALALGAGLTLAGAVIAKRG